MKREFKKKEEHLEDFTANNIIKSIDNQLVELNKSNNEVENIFAILRSKVLSDKDEESIRKVLNSSLELSSNMQRSFMEEF